MAQIRINQGQNFKGIEASSEKRKKVVEWGGGAQKVLISFLRLGSSIWIFQI